MNRIDFLHGFSLCELQHYIRNVGEERGWGKESLLVRLSGLTEEMGELAKEVRRYLGIKNGSTPLKNQTQLGSEMADVLICLLDLANIAQVDLGQSLIEKERDNSSRYWSGLISREVLGIE